MQQKTSLKLSIIVPHYNSADLLPKLLSTIPNIPEIEVIVVDDHSTEKLKEFMECKSKFCNRNIFFYDNEPDRKGAGAARNVGMRHAKGKYLLFADADDWFADSFWSIVQKNMADGADIIFFPPKSQWDSGKHANRHLPYAQRVRNYLSNPSRENELKLRCLYWSPCSKMVKRSMVVKNGISFEEIQFSNDILFSVKIGICANTIKASENTIYYILRHQGSLTACKDEAALMIRRKAWCRTYFYLRRNLNRHDFRLLGYTEKNDWEQIKFAISTLWKEFLIK